MAPATRIRSRTIDDTVKVRASAHAAAVTHPRSPYSAPLTQRANEDLGQHEQLPASSDEAQMRGKTKIAGGCCTHLFLS